MKRRSLTAVIGVLAIFALASIGFASWIITNPNSGTETPGTIVVDDVTSEVFSITTTWDATSNGKIVFGKPVDYVEKETDWLTSDSAEKENLEAELTIKFNKKDNVDLESILTATPVKLALKVVDNNVVSDNEEDKILSDVDAASLFSNLTLAAPVLKIKVGSSFVDFDGTIDFADLDSDATCVIKVIFAWGSATGNVNPYEYYNAIKFGTDQDPSEEVLPIEVVAEEYLKQLYNDFEGISYKLTLSDK